ncbi:TPA: NERD domain-containing protein [Vibrio diabolicus]
MKTEQEIFEEIELLSTQAGFWEVIAFFCLKDTFIHLSGNSLDENRLAQQFDKTKLSRTELSTLIGLACKSGFHDKKLTFDELKERAEQVWTLLEELHHSFYSPSSMVTEISKREDVDAIDKEWPELIKLLEADSDRNHFMREAIFYGGDGAYKHQYRDLAITRYANDEDWIKENKGFSISEAASVFSAIERVLLENANRAISEQKSWPLTHHLPVFQFNLSEIEKQSSIPIETVEAVVFAFSAVPNEGMDCFKSVDDFNHRNAFPIIKVDGVTFAVFQAYSLWESLYESPFFWFDADKSYVPVASKNRGAFTEDFTAERLALVFGEDNVFTNIDIFDGKNKAGEIDVLVMFGSTAIVVQAKSKKLTIEARKGNSKQLAGDFKKAVQDAYDQAYLCCQLLQSDRCSFKKVSGDEITVSSHLKTIFPVCIVSEHFPALAAQARHFLQYKTNGVIAHPYVMDVFLVDLITEMLHSPLRVIDYLKKRCGFGDSILSNHELVILSTYIKQNLYFEENPTLVMLEDDISADLELAMLVRREGYSGEPTPSGFLTIHKGTHVGNIIDDIESSKDYGHLQLGLHLLSLSGDSIKLIDQAISRMISQFHVDNRHHDISLPLLDEKTGLTVHVNENSDEESYKSLVAHCEKRKYSCKANSWVGCCFSPRRERLRFSTYHESEWCQSDDMDKLVANLPPLSPRHRVKNLDQLSFGSQRKRAQEKIGRNQPCSCGSGKKYKRCCIS